MTVHISFTSDARQSAEDIKRYDTQVQKVSTSVRQYRDRTQALKREQQALNRLLQGAPVANRTLFRSYQQLTHQATILANRKRALASNTSLTTRAMSTAVPIADKLTGAYSRLAAAATAANAAQAGAATGTGTPGASGRVRNIGLGSVGLGGLAGAGSALALGRAAMQGEQAETTITRMLARNTKQSADALRQFNRIAKDTPHNLNDVSAAVFNTSTLLGFYGDDLHKVVEAQAQFATVTGQSLPNINQLISQTFKAFGTSDADSAVQQLDIILGLVQEYRLNVPALLASLGRTGSTFRALGFDLAETANLMAQITQHGVNVEQINEPIRQMVVNMAKAGLDPREGLIAAVAAIKDAESDAEAFRLGSEIFGTEGGHVFVDMIREQALPALLDLEAQILDGNVPAIKDLYEETKTTGEEFSTLANKFKVGAKDAITPALKDSMSLMERFSGLFDSISGALPGGTNPLTGESKQSLAEQAALSAAAEMRNAQMATLKEARVSAEAARDAAQAAAMAATEVATTLISQRAAWVTLQEENAFGFMPRDMWGRRGGTQAQMDAFAASAAAQREAAYRLTPRGAGITNNLPFSNLQQLYHGGQEIARQTEESMLRRTTQTFFGPGTGGNLWDGGDSTANLIYHGDRTALYEERFLKLLEEIRDKDQEMNIYLDGNLLDRVAMGPIAGRARGSC